MRLESPGTFIISPNPLVRELLAEVLRVRLGVHCSGMGSSIADWPADAAAQLLILAGEADGGDTDTLAARNSRGDEVRVVRIDSADSIDAIVDAVRRALNIVPASLEQLTPHEIQVLIALAAGQRNAEIARRQRRSVKTVEKHRANVRRKLGARTVAHLTAYAIRAGLLDFDSILVPRRASQ